MFVSASGLVGLVSIVIVVRPVFGISVQDLSALRYDLVCIKWSWLHCAVGATTLDRIYFSVKSGLYSLVIVIANVCEVSLLFYVPYLLLIMPMRVSPEAITNLVGRVTQPRYRYRRDHLDSPSS